MVYCVIMVVERKEEMVSASGDPSANFESVTPQSEQETVKVENSLPTSASYIMSPPGDWEAVWARVDAVQAHLQFVIYRDLRELTETFEVSKGKEELDESKLMMLHDWLREKINWMSDIDQDRE